MTYRRMIQLSVLSSIVLPLAIAGAQAKQQSSSSGGANVRAQIESVNKRFIDLFNKGDVDAFAKVYATDAMILPPNAEAIRGQSAIAEFWKGGWKAGLRNVALTTTEVDVHGNTAYELGTASLEMHRPDGSLAGKDSGKYIVVWKRNAAGQWQWYRDIWNSNLPAAAK